MIVVEKKSSLLLHFDNTVQQRAVCKEFSTEHRQAERIKKLKPWLKDWDGRINFCKPAQHDRTLYKLPIGFKPKLLKFLEEEGVAFEFKSKIDLDPTPFGQYLYDIAKNQPITLDQVQEDACSALLGGRRRVIELGTASGKTEIVINAFECVRKVYPDVVMCFIVPKLNLLSQTRERILNRIRDIKKVGIIGDGEFDVEGAQIVVATAASACGADHLVNSEALKVWLSTVNILALDEAHHSASDQWKKIIELCNPLWLWAVSAKVTFHDRKNQLRHMTLEGMFGEPVYKGRSEKRTCPVTVKFYYHDSWDGVLFEKGFKTRFVMGLKASFRLVPGGSWYEGMWRGPDMEGELSVDDDPDLFILNKAGKLVPDKTKFGIYMKSDDDKWEKVDPPSGYVVYGNVHDMGIMEFLPRNKWACDMAKDFAKRKEPFIISVNRRRHANKINNMLAKMGINVTKVTGKMAGIKQNEVMGKLRTGEIAGIVAVYSIISEGVDIPNLLHLIKLDGIAEEQVLTQQVGRCQRVFEGKTMGYIHIPRDTQEKHLDRTCGKMVGHFTRVKVPIKKVRVEEKFALV